MNLRVTIGFLVVAVLLGVAVYGLDKFNIGPTPSANSTATAAAGQSLQVFSFDDSKVNAFEMRQGDKMVRIEKKEDIWTIADTGESANRTSFNSLIVRMSQLRSTRRVDNPGDLSQYGLDNPKDTAIAELNDGTRYGLQTGNKTPVATGTYAKALEGGEVFVIQDQFVSDLERLLNDPKEPPTPTPRPATPTVDASAAITTPTPVP